MILTTYATPSHAEMCERFVVARGEASGFDGGRLFNDDQMCPSGNFGSEGFSQQTWGKVKMLAGLPLAENYCYVDADCVIFPGLADWCRHWLHENPGAIGHGDDILQLCMGTLVWRQTEITASWFRYVYDTAILLGRHDQETVQVIREIAQNLPVELSRLPNTIFANHASRLDRDNTPWDGQMDLFVPQTCLCWHANFCVGVQRKTAMLECVLKKQAQFSCTA